MKVQDQIKSVENGFDVSNHTFLNQLTDGLQKRIGEIVPDLSIIPTGKKAGKGNISLTLMGQVTLENMEDKDHMDEKVRQLMNSLKNPAYLLALVKS